MANTENYQTIIFNKIKKVDSNRLKITNTVHLYKCIFKSNTLKWFVPWLVIMHCFAPNVQTIFAPSSLNRKDFFKN